MGRVAAQFLVGKRGHQGGVDKREKCGMIRRDSNVNSISHLKLPSTISQLDLKGDRTG
jgi:hypothetical protein